MSQERFKINPYLVSLTSVTVRNLRNEWPDIYIIDKDCFPENPLAQDKLLEALSHEKSIMRIKLIYYLENIIGFILYEWGPAKIQLTKLAIEDSFQKESIFKAILYLLIDELDERRRTLIINPNINPIIFIDLLISIGFKRSSERTKKTKVRYRYHYGEQNRKHVRELSLMYQPR